MRDKERTIVGGLPYPPTTILGTTTGYVGKMKHQLGVKRGDTVTHRRRAVGSNLYVGSNERYKLTL